MNTATHPLAERIAATLDAPVKVAVVLGSGIKALEDLVNGGSCKYAELPGFPTATVAGHAGVLSWGQLGQGGPGVMVARGRFHLYEGHGLDEALMLVNLFHQLGVPNVVLTNAAGGLRADWKPGDLMLIDDHLAFQGSQAGLPVQLPGGLDAEWGPYHPREAYDGPWRERLAAHCLKEGVPLRRGVYVGLMGPSYETMGENRFLITAGADAVGMSTVPEAARASSNAMRVVGVSCITNISITPSGAAETSHQEVVDVAKAASANMEAVLRGAIHTAP